MQKFLILSTVAAALALPVFAMEDAVATRKNLMYSNGASAALAGAMLKQEVPYSPVAAKSVLYSLNATSMAFGDYFPEGSGAGDTKARDTIWSDPEGFEAELVKFRTSASEAVAAAGREGPADLPAFQAAVLPVLDSCKTCHEGYHVPD
jgi:cytochrome c556